MTNILLITGEDCPRCETLKQYLKARGVAFQERKIRANNAEDMAELRTDGYFVTSFPALVVGDKLYQSDFLLTATGKVRDLGAAIG